MCKKKGMTGQFTSKILKGTIFNKSWSDFEEELWNTFYVIEEKPYCCFIYLQIARILSLKKILVV